MENKERMASRRSRVIERIANGTHEAYVALMELDAQVTLGERRVAFPEFANTVQRRLSGRPRSRTSTTRRRRLPTLRRR